MMLKIGTAKDISTIHKAADSILDSQTYKRSEPDPERSE